jgi:hypothetical protein
MNANEKKIARKFKLSAEAVAVLVAAGLDNPHKIKEAARADKLPHGFAEKLSRWHKKQQGEG